MDGEENRIPAKQKKKKSNIMILKNKLYSNETIYSKRQLSTIDRLQIASPSLHHLNFPTVEKFS